MNPNDAPKQMPQAGVSSLQAGVAFMQGVVESSRLAVGEMEKQLQRAEGSSAAQMQEVVENVLKGYGTFVTEMTVAARRAADEFRSESGRLTAKRLPGGPTGENATATTSGAPTSQN